jgi:2-dehydro-3-deoxyphosphogluconate aldolase / (4S)-4-hydroxy-2-oxoglutarate aldolase
MNSTLQTILETGVIAIMRSKSATGLVDAARALASGGVRAIEVTMTTPGALEAIAAAASDSSGDYVIGAGSVLDAESASLAIQAGAEFLVMPVAALDAVRVAKRRGKVAVPGAFTPTEILSCLHAGADLVKVFPASSVGPGYIKSVLAPLPQAPLVPVGGVHADNAGDYIRAGAVAVGVGGALVNTQVLARGDWCELTESARRYVDAIADARN